MLLPSNFYRFNWGKTRGPGSNVTVTMITKPFVLPFPSMRPMPSPLGDPAAALAQLLWAGTVLVLVLVPLQVLVHTGADEGGKTGLASAFVRQPECVHSRRYEEINIRGYGPFSPSRCASSFGLPMTCTGTCSTTGATTGAGSSTTTASAGAGGRATFGRRSDLTRFSFLLFATNNIDSYNDENSAYANNSYDDEYDGDGEESYNVDYSYPQSDEEDYGSDYDLSIHDALENISDHNDDDYEGFDEKIDDNFIGNTVDNPKLFGTQNDHGDDDDDDDDDDDESGVDTEPGTIQSPFELQQAIQQILSDTKPLVDSPSKSRAGSSVTTKPPDLIAASDTTIAARIQNGGHMEYGSDNNNPATSLPNPTNPSSSTELLDRLQQITVRYELAKQQQQDPGGVMQNDVLLPQNRRNGGDNNQISEQLKKEYREFLKNSGTGVTYNSGTWWSTSERDKNDAAVRDGESRNRPTNENDTENKSSRKASDHFNSSASTTPDEGYGWQKLFDEAYSSNEDYADIPEEDIDEEILKGFNSVTGTDTTPKKRAIPSASVRGRDQNDFLRNDDDDDDFPFGTVPDMGPSRGNDYPQENGSYSNKNVAGLDKEPTTLEGVLQVLHQHMEEQAFKERTNPTAVQGENELSRKQIFEQEQAFFRQSKQFQQALAGRQVDSSGRPITNPREKRNNHNNTATPLFKDSDTEPQDGHQHDNGIAVDANGDTYQEYSKRQRRLKFLEWQESEYKKLDAAIEEWNKERPVKLAKRMQSYYQQQELETKKRSQAESDQQGRQTPHQGLAQQSGGNQPKREISSSDGRRQEYHKPKSNRTRSSLSPQQQQQQQQRASGQAFARPNERQKKSTSASVKVSATAPSAGNKKTRGRNIDSRSDPRTLMQQSQRRPRIGMSKREPRSTSRQQNRLGTTGGSPAPRTQPLKNADQAEREKRPRQEARSSNEREKAFQEYLQEQRRWLQTQEHNRDEDAGEKHWKWSGKDKSQVQQRQQVEDDKKPNKHDDKK